MGVLRQKSVGRAPSISKCSEKDIFVLIFVSFHQGKEKRKTVHLKIRKSFMAKEK